MREQRVLYIDDVCAMLGASRDAVRGMIRRGELPRPGKIGRRLAWRRDAIESMIESVGA